jgi:hypothetical protein
LGIEEEDYFHWTKYTLLNQQLEKTHIINDENNNEDFIVLA